MSYWSLIDDPDLVARWNGDGDGDNVGDAINAANPGTYDGTWLGTPAYADPPVGKGDGKAFHFLSTASTDIVQFTGVPQENDGITYLAWVDLLTVSTGQRFLFGHDTSAKGVHLERWSDLGLFKLAGDVGGFDCRTAGVEAWNPGWNHWCVTSSSNIDDRQFYKNGSLLPRTTSTYPQGLNFNQLGRRQSFNYPALYQYDSRIYSRVLSADEVADVFAGPEPKDIAGTLDANGAYTLTATDPNNGAISWAWVLAEPDGTSVAQGTGASGTIDLSALPAGTYYLLSRASNLGGYIEGDYATRVSEYGVADDGYHEVASVVVVQSVFTGVRVHTIKRLPHVHTIRRPIRVHTIKRPIRVHTITRG